MSDAAKNCLLDFIVHTDSLPFPLERLMLDSAAPQMLDFLSLSETEAGVVSEPLIGNVIPDLLVGRWLPGACCLTARLTAKESSVLASVEAADQTTITALSASLYLHSFTARTILKRLAKCGAVQVNDEVITLSSAAESRCWELIAFEFKLHKWRDAVDQALTYKTFADKAYVVLDAARCSSLTNVDQTCREKAIGLILQNPLGMKTIYDPPSQNVQSGDRFLAIQKLGVATRPTTRLVQTRATS